MKTFITTVMLLLDLTGTALACSPVACMNEDTPKQLRSDCLHLKKHYPKLEDLQDYLLPDEPADLAKVCQKVGVQPWWTRADAQEQDKPYQSQTPMPKVLLGHWVQIDGVVNVKEGPALLTIDPHTVSFGPGFVCKATSITPNAEDGSWLSKYGTVVAIKLRCPGSSDTEEDVLSFVKFWEKVPVVLITGPQNPGTIYGRNYVRRARKLSRHKRPSARRIATPAQAPAAGRSVAISMAAECSRPSMATECDDEFSRSLSPITVDSASMKIVAVDINQKLTIYWRQKKTCYSLFD